MISCCYLWTFPGRSSRGARAVCIPQAEEAMPPRQRRVEASRGQPAGQGGAAPHGEPAVVRTVPQLERVTPLPGAWTTAAELRSRLNLQHQHRKGWQDRPSRLLVGFPGLLGLAAEWEEGEFYLAQDLFLPLVDVNKKQPMILAPLFSNTSTGEHQGSQLPCEAGGLPSTWEGELGRTWSDVAKCPPLLGEGL